MAPNNGTGMGGPTLPVEDIAQAYKDLMRGQDAASVLEASLASFESKLQAILQQTRDNDGASAPGQAQDKGQDQGREQGQASPTAEPGKESAAADADGKEETGR